ncbi:S-layer homology domain-containing protein [Anoxybacillus kestanbolensis]|uniref:S-layer homology domain-containing protein n=1 Tax=Anoxybacillus kestanbolensis TaxID=227476 RepID=UPI00208DBC7D|nr:S-layer homology domain-containing protein [Anoxybacillus kestanbolensis]MCL9970462.1 S-layer homology domain-containing protein [Anoxybacillus kestanbolensis]
MAYQPKSYRKFLAGTVSAAVVASAIAPVASAASFTDVAGSVHADDIATLVAKGYIKGYGDGTFKPNQSLTRGEAAIIFSRILKDMGVTEKGAGFPDVPAEKAELAEAVAIVQAAGIMTGDEKGNFNPNANITREQMAKVLVEAFDLMKPADFVSNVTDLDKAASWAREYIQVLDATDVTLNTEFMPKQNVTRGQFASFVVRAMNVGVTAANITGVAFVDLNTLEVTFNGELKEVKKEDFAIEGVEIESVSIKAAAAAEAKTTVVVIKTKTALEEGKAYNVSYKGQTTDKAKVDVPVVTPKVESVSANNLKVVTVKFNKEIDATTIKADTVKVYVNSSTTATTVDTTPSSVAAGQVGYILGEDKKTLSIVFGTALNQSDNVKVVVDGVKTTNQATVEKHETTLTVTDTTAPVAEKVEVVNNKKVKLYFSEPVNLDTAGIYKTTDVANAGVSLTVDGSKSFAKFTPVPEQNAVEVEFFNALADGSHTIEVADVKDFAGFKASAKSFTINTAADTKAPVATSIEYVSRTQIKVHFDEALKDAGGSTPTGTFEVYEAGNSTNLFSSASLSTDGKTVTITVSPAFTVAATVGLDVKYKNVEDIFGNKTTDFVTLSGKAEDDAVKPTVSSVEVLDGNVLKVTFSEKVNAAGQTAQFKLYKEDGTTVVASAAASVVNYDTTNPDGKTFKVTFNELSNINSASYKLKVTGTQDTSIRQNTIDDVMLPFTAKDSKAPDLVTAVLKADASGNNDKIELVFSEAMDTTLLNNVANYFVGNGAANIPLNTISGAKVESISADGKKVTLLVPDADNSDATGGLSAAVDSIAMPALKDTTGNYISNASIASPFTVGTSYTAMTASDLKVEATGKNTIVVTALNGYYFTTADANAFKVERDGTDGTNLYDLGIVAAQLSADGKTITLTTSVPLTADAKYTDSGTPYAVDLFINGTAVKDQNGTPVTIADTASIDIQDKIKATQQTPALKASTTDVIQVAFDEAVAKATGITNDLLASAFEVKVGTTTLTPVVDYTATINGNGEVELTITKAGVKNADVTVKLVKPEYLVDTNGNGVNALDVKTVSGVTEKVAPTVVTAVENSTTQVTLTFSEKLDASTVTLANFGGTAAPSAVSLGSDGKTVVVTVGAMSGTETITVGAGVKDEAGNAITPVTLTRGTDF